MYFYHAYIIVHSFLLFIILLDSVLHCLVPLLEKKVLVILTDVAYGHKRLAFTSCMLHELTELNLQISHCIILGLSERSGFR